MQQRPIPVRSTWDGQLTGADVLLHEVASHGAQITNP